MHPYLKHLLYDIQNAHREEESNEEALNEQQDDSIEAHLREVEAWISGEGEQKLREFCGLNEEDFPPDNQFTDDEIRRVNAAFKNMLNSWNIVLDVPENVPPRFVYKLIGTILNSECSPLTTGTCHFDFCSGVPEGCDWEQDCPCSKILENE